MIRVCVCVCVREDANVFLCSYNSNSRDNTTFNISSQLIKLLEKILNKIIEHTDMNF